MSQKWFTDNVKEEKNKNYVIPNCFRQFELAKCTLFCIDKTNHSSNSQSRIQENKMIRDHNDDKKSRSVQIWQSVLLHLWVTYNECM